MTLREWLDKKIDRLNKWPYEPLDTYGTQYREGYCKACRDVRDLLGKTDLSSNQPKEESS